jgi:hypothetical protein
MKTKWPGCPMQEPSRAIPRVGDSCPPSTYRSRATANRTTNLAVFESVKKPHKIHSLSKNNLYFHTLFRCISKISIQHHSHEAHANHGLALFMLLLCI